MAKIAHQYGAQILLTEYTFDSLKATYRTRQVDKVIVKGKSKPVKIYEAIDYGRFRDLNQELERFMENAVNPTKYIQNNDSTHHMWT